MDFNAIWSSIISSSIYGIIVKFFGGLFGYSKNKNKNITIKNNSKIESSFKGSSEGINISKSEVKDSFK